MAALLLASCGSAGLPIPDLKPYRIEIQQGNFVSQEMVSQLKAGMSKDQVRFVLGTPLIADTFHADRWDYVFRRQRANSNELEQRKIAVFFEDGKLKRVEGDVKPAAGADKPAANADKSAAPPAAPADDKPQERSWWQRLKDKF
jgi:outer membrane protein assembly factor BamE